MKTNNNSSDKDDGASPTSEGCGVEGNAVSEETPPHRLPIHLQMQQQTQAGTTDWIHRICQQCGLSSELQANCEQQSSGSNGTMLASVSILRALLQGMTSPPITSAFIQECVEWETARSTENHSNNSSSSAVETFSSLKNPIAPNATVVVLEQLSPSLKRLLGQLPGLLPFVPLVFWRALLRLLVMQLTGESKEEYDYSLFRIRPPSSTETLESATTSEQAGQHQTVPGGKQAQQDRQRRRQQQVNQYQQRQQQRSALFYTMVRFKLQWPDGVTKLIELMEYLASEAATIPQSVAASATTVDNQRSGTGSVKGIPTMTLLLGPVSRLLGLHGIAGMSVREVHLLLELLRHGSTIRSRAKPSGTLPKATAIPIATVLLRFWLVRAWTVTVSGSVWEPTRRLVSPETDYQALLSDYWLYYNNNNAALNTPAAATNHTKCFPANFFSFAMPGLGLQRRIQSGLDASTNNNGNRKQKQLSSTSSWPFKHDFGMAVWVRAERFDASNSIILFQATQLPFQAGIQVSLVPITKTACHVVVTITDDEPSSSFLLSGSRNGSNKTTKIVKECILHERIWYHVALRHTRSRLKGVFSLSSREQLSVYLDGKQVWTDLVPLPKIRSDNDSRITGGSSGKNNSHLELSFGSNLVGQMGAFYLFHEPVSDATIRALFNNNGSTNDRKPEKNHSRSKSQTTIATVGKEGNKKTVESRLWDAQSEDIVKKSEILGVTLNQEDLEDIVLSNRHHFLPSSQHTSGGVPSSSRSCQRLGKNPTVWDLVEDDVDNANPLSQAAFKSKIYMVLDPSRCESGVAIEHHCGAHLRLREDSTHGSIVQPFVSVNVQDVISSLGGIEVLLTPCRSILNGDLEATVTTAYGQNLFSGNCWFLIHSIPDILQLLAVFLRRHNEHAREMLRCGAVGLFEHFIHLNKERGQENNRASLVSAAVESMVFARHLVLGLVDLRLSCTHYIGLEAKVVGRLIFNFPLWFQNTEKETAFMSSLMPILGLFCSSETQKMHACVRIKPLILFLGGVVNMKDEKESNDRPTNDTSELSSTSLKVTNRTLLELLVRMIWVLLKAGSTSDGVLSLVGLMSYYLELEWDCAMKEKLPYSPEPLKEESKSRKGRFFVLVRMCSLMLSLIEDSESGTQFCGMVAAICGGTQGGVAWICSAMVNSHSDEIRGIGVRCAVSYVEQASHFSDLQFPSPMASNDLKSIQTLENTLHLLSNVGHGLLNLDIGRSIEAIGQAGVFSPDKTRVTPRVVYKFLWHLLKSHRFNLHSWSEASLFYMVFQETRATPYDPQHEGIDPYGLQFLQDRRVLQADVELRNNLGFNTMIRLVRFLPRSFSIRWMSELRGLSTLKPELWDRISSVSDWQPSVFQFISELLELAAPNRQGATDTESGILRDLNTVVAFYAALLGFLLRKGGEQALESIEEAVSLQRVCLNGREVISLVLSAMLHDLHAGGVTATTTTDSKLLKAPAALADSAQMVRNAIVSSGTVDMTLPAAVSCWRSLRHLTAVCVGLITQFGYCGTAIFENERACLTVDDHSGGFFGIRIQEGPDFAFPVEEAQALLIQSQSCTREDQPESLLKYASVHISAQMLSLLDLFVFPDSHEASEANSQLYGLSLVRSTESRIGKPQGPLLLSLIRLSLILLTYLEPCSVKLLQCVSRLRCFLHWLLELIREVETLHGFSSAFHALSGPYDRLLLSIVLHCRYALRRCGLLLEELETPGSDVHFPTKEDQKKAYRRLLRVGLELRDLLATSFERRNEVLKMSLSDSAFNSLEKCLKAVPPKKSAGDEKKKSTHPKEAVVRSLLSSSFVIDFETSRITNVLKTSGVTAAAASTNQKENTYLSQITLESDKIAVAVEKALNVAFETYLEDQRKWAETGAVRDLEYEGDINLKKLTMAHGNDLQTLETTLRSREEHAKKRMGNLHKTSCGIWQESSYSKIPTARDQLHRNHSLVQNMSFDDHAAASFHLVSENERQKEQKEKEERQKAKADLQALIERHAIAFLPTDDDIDDDALAEEDDSRVLMENGDSMMTVSEDQQESTTEVVASAESHDNSADSWAKTYFWAENEAVVARFDSAIKVTLTRTVEGEILLTTHCIYFRATSDAINVVTRQADNNDQCPHKRWRLSRLKETYGRRFMLRPQAMELFFSDGQEVFFNFVSGTRERNRFHNKLRNNCKVPLLFSPKTLNPKNVFQRSHWTELWRKRRISNFEYIMALNRMAGRSFNDVAQYPVFPWVISDYTSNTIDLQDPAVFRDLSKPVGALNPDRLEMLLERYRELDQFGFSENEKFLYGSHYSSPGIIINYLIRQEPFTTMHVGLQSGRFDFPDRLFFDIQETWRGCNTSSSDVKELIPEFFTLPEMFINTNRFPLGTTQRGHVVDNVQLPPWAKGSAYEFVRIQRLALESDYVSANLPHWIDLIFGHKQRGDAAVVAHNLFHHLSYEGSVDIEKITDELDRQAAEAHIQSFGQTPSQLVVKDPHPQRLAADESWKHLVNIEAKAVKLRCHTPLPSTKAKRSYKTHNNHAAVKIQVLAHSLVVVYSDLMVGTFKFDDTNKHTRLQLESLVALPSRQLSHSRAVLKRGSAAPQTMDSGSSPLSIGNWSFALTLGGYEMEQIRRKTLMPTRLGSAKDALYADATSLLVSCGYWDNTIRLQSTDSSASWRLECHENGGHLGQIRCLAMAEGDGFLLTGGEDCTCRLWMVDYPDLAQSLADGYTQTYLGHSLLAKDAQQQVLGCLHVLWGQTSPITSVALSLELDVCASGAMDGKVCLYTIRKGTFLRSFVPPKVGSTKPKNKDNDKDKDRDDAPLYVAKLAMESHGRIVVHMASDSQKECNSLHTYTVNGKCLCSASAGGERITDLLITGEILISGGTHCHVYLRNLMTLQILSGLDLTRHGPIRCMTLTPDRLNPIAQHLFIGSDDGMISIVDRAEEED